MNSIEKEILKSKYALQIAKVQHLIVKIKIEKDILALLKLANSQVNTDKDVPDLRFSNMLKENRKKEKINEEEKKEINYVTGKPVGKVLFPTLKPSDFKSINPEDYEKTDIRAEPTQAIGGSKPTRNYNSIV